MSACGAKSTIKGAGMGLFADKDYDKGERVTFYSGTYSDNPTLEGDRVIQITKILSIDGDGRCRMECSRGDLINHDPDRANCRYAWSSVGPKKLKLVHIVTKRRVLQGEEFLIDYGPHYQFKVVYSNSQNPGQH